MYVRYKPKFTAGPDGLPAFFVKDCISTFSQPLCYIFNLSLTTNTFPTMWKESKICPVYKKNGKSDITNYRPITIINNFSKVFEFVIHDYIYSHTRNIISVHQHGFMLGRSTTTNLLCLTEYLCKELDRGGQVDVVYTDFSKAFDRLDHAILLNKLKNFGLSEQFVSFFKSYLSDRHQYVSYRGFKSVMFNSKSGVPQGSVLGPILFNVFINDITTDLNCQYLLYADDIKIYSKINCYADTEILQNDLRKIHNWCIKNNLPMNIEKCNVVTYTRQHKPIITEYKLNNNILQRVNSFKDLGVIFDNKLTFTHHIQNITSSAYRSLGFVIRHSKDFKNTHTLQIMYNSFVRSKLEYADIVWSPYYGVHINHLENVQRKFLKYLCLTEDNIYPPIGINHEHLINRFSFDLLINRRKLHGSVFLYKIINNKFDCLDILKLIDLHVPPKATRLQKTFAIKFSHTNILKYSPINAVCENYNQIQNKVDIFCCSTRDIAINNI